MKALARHSGAQAPRVGARWLGVLAALVVLGTAGEVLAQAAANPQAQGLAGGGKRIYQVNMQGQYRRLAVGDEDLANDQSAIYAARLWVDAFAGARFFVSAGFNQSFVAEQDDTSFRFRDMQVGLNYVTPFELGGQKFTSLHFGSLFVPTSRASQKQDLIVAPMYLNMTVFSPMKNLAVLVVPYFRYRFHEYAERAGEQGGMNTMLDTGFETGFAYTFLRSKTVGNIAVGGDVGSQWVRRYSSREDFESASSDQALWLQNYSWDAYLSWSPLPQLQAVLGIEQGGPVLRDGVVNTFFMHRDETEVVLSVLGTY